MVGAGTGLYGQHIDANASGIGKNVNAFNENLSVYPNPIKNAAIISYTIKSNEHVSLTLYDIMGKKVKTIVNENKIAGTYNAHINCNKLAKGMYVVKLQAGTTVSTQDVVIE